MQKVLALALAGDNQREIDRQELGGAGGPINSHFCFRMQEELGVFSRVLVSRRLTPRCRRAGRGANSESS